jgi:ribokinase
MTVRALVVGSLVMDLAFHVPRIPEPGEVVAADDFGTFRGGKGYNQAVTLARLGSDVTMVGAVGADDYGDAFVRALAAEGVDAQRVVALRGVSTAVAVPLITPDGDVRFVQHPGANHLLSPAHCADLPDCDVLLLQGEVTPMASEHAARVIRGRGATVLLNPAPVADISAELLDAATMVCPNEVEARALTGLPDAEGVELARALATGDRVAVVTLGAAGAAWADGRDSGTVTPPAITAVDATAAGDSFCAALAVAIAEGQPLAAAVRFACAAGAHAATIRGAEPALPRRSDIERLLGT